MEVSGYIKTGDDLIECSTGFTNTIQMAGGNYKKDAKGNVLV
jgi:hypothetical protein